MRNCTYRECPKCKEEVAFIAKTELAKAPKHFSLLLVVPRGLPTADEIRAVLDLVPMAINLSSELCMLH